jgi:lysophospholipase L1-like esterase
MTTDIRRGLTSRTGVARPWAVCALAIALSPVLPMVAQETLAPPPAPRTGGWMTRHQQNADRIKQGGVDLVFIGDSITQNYEKANPPNENFKPTWDYFYGDRKAVNLGISGDTTANVLWRLENGEFDGIQPKAAVILIGTNDTNHGGSAEQTSAGIDEIVKLVHAKSPATKILLLGILPSHISDAKSQKDADVNAYLAKRYAASSYVSYLDIGGVFRKNGQVEDDLFYDPRLSTPRPPLHPDTLGQHRMAAAIEPVLSKLLGDRCKCE